MATILDQLKHLEDGHEHIQTIKADHGPMKSLMQDWYKKQLKEAAAAKKPKKKEMPKVANVPLF